MCGHSVGLSICSIHAERRWRLRFVENFSWRPSPFDSKMAADRCRWRVMNDPPVSSKTDAGQWSLTIILIIIIVSAGRRKRVGGSSSSVRFVCRHTVRLAAESFKHVRRWLMGTTFNPSVRISFQNRRQHSVAVKSNFKTHLPDYLQ